MAGRVVTNTTNIFGIDTGDEIVLGSRRFKVTGHAYEQRFGIEDPKFWVKRVVDCDTGEKKLAKLAFYESFNTVLAGAKIKCFRDPEKEGNILEMVRHNPHFMQGEVLYDEKGNNIRVLDIVPGSNLFVHLGSIRVPYKTYFTTILPGLFKNLIRSFEAIRLLHASGFRHGDIRSDHIIIDDRTGTFVWIDFDYDFTAPENIFSLDIFGLGNVLMYVVGMGFHNFYNIKNDKYTYGDLLDKLEPADFSLLDKQRLVNIRKLYPQIPETMNNILMHFSREADVYYEIVEEIIEDMTRCLQAFSE